MFKNLFPIFSSSPKATATTPKAGIVFLNLYSWLLTLDGVHSLLSALLTLASLVWVIVQIATKLREQKNPKTK